MIMWSITFLLDNKGFFCNDYPYFTLKLGHKIHPRTAMEDILILQQAQPLERLDHSVWYIQDYFLWSWWIRLERT